MIEMEKLLQKNPGLRSRIAFHVPFEDYDADELCKIATLIGKNKGISFEDAALQKLGTIFETARKQSDFGNGRYVRNVLEQAKMNQASRLLEYDFEDITTEEITTIKAVDIVIPENAENPLLAHEFINYMLEYDIAYTNSEWVCYTSPHKDVLTDLSSMGGYFDGNVAYLPRQGYEKDEVFEDNRVLKEKLTELWIKVKAGE